MLDQIINNPDLNKYLSAFETGQTIFLENDESQDLYILVSGELDVLKGNKTIAEITERGALFGEMSFLLGDRRTATVKARNDAKTIRIPKEQITTFLGEFPSVAHDITRLLAQRLDKASQIVYGLKEFCDQLPDAVILTDKEGKILTWNTASEKLYGREWDQMRHRSAEEIYEEPEDYKQFLEDLQSRYSISEKVLKVNHPEKGTRFISTSTTLLYDGHHNLQGVLSLGRDVTKVKSLERKYRRVRNWLIPSFILLALMAGAFFFGYPYFSKGYQSVDIKKQELRNHMAKDYFLLTSLLVQPFAAGDRSKTCQLMKEFFDIQDKTSTPYIGLLLLDREKKVFSAHSVKSCIDVKKMVGSSYASIEFKGSESSLHRVLTVYRADKEHPMGHKGIEVSFEVTKDNQFMGWLIFQMDVDLLVQEYGIDEEGLKQFEFKKH